MPCQNSTKNRWCKISWGTRHLLIPIPHRKPPSAAWKDPIATASRQSSMSHYNRRPTKSKKNWGGGQSPNPAYWPRAISKTIKYSVWAIRYKKTHLTNTGEIVDECTCYQLRCKLILKNKVHTWLVEMLSINFKLREQKYKYSVWIQCLKK